MSARVGGSAFPVRLHPGGMAEEGMTLRDWFAGQALAGLLAADHVASDWDHAEVAEEAYIRADAMLAAREEASR